MKSIAHLYTRPRYLPPTKVERCALDHSLISAGGFIESCTLHRRLLSIRSVIREGAELIGRSPARSKGR